MESTPDLFKRRLKSAIKANGHEISLKKERYWSLRLVIVDMFFNLYFGLPPNSYYFLFLIFKLKSI